MMDEIHNLKIRTYENKLIIQKSQLQYFQIQLKPHFYSELPENSLRYDSTE